MRNLEYHHKTMDLAQIFSIVQSNMAKTGFEMDGAVFQQMPESRSTLNTPVTF